MSNGLKETTGTPEKISHAIVRHFEKEVMTFLPKNKDKNKTPIIEKDLFINAIKQLARKNNGFQGINEAKLISEIQRCAYDGLLPDGREAVINFYKGDPTYIPMVGGVIKMMYRTGLVSSVESHIVYETDFIEYVLGDNATLVHRPNIKNNRGKMIAVYAIAKLKDGTIFREVLSEIDIAHARKSSKTAIVWDAHPSEMWKKTAVHRLWKRMPKEMVAGKSMVEYNEDRNEYDDAIDVEASAPTPIHELGDMPEVIEAPRQTVDDHLSQLAGVL